MLQSSITAWLKKPATVKKNTDEPIPLPSSTPKSQPSAPQIGGPKSEPEPHQRESDNPEKAEVQHASPSKNLALPTLPANVELVPLTEDLIPSFKRLNALMLPIPYPPIFYTESMTEPYHSITLMALWHATALSDTPPSNNEKPRLVGAIRCRILPSANLYISTICLLAPYRSHGIASHLLQRIISKASEEHGVKCVTAHVWEANEDGLEWYEKRGFEIIGNEAAYYGKLRPSGAVLVRKWIGVADLLAHTDAATTVSK